MVHQPTGIDPEIKLLKSTLFDLIQDYMIKYLALTVHWLWATEELPSQIWSKLAHLDIVDIKSTQYYQREGVKKQNHSKVCRGRYTPLLSVTGVFDPFANSPLSQLWEPHTGTLGAPEHGHQDITRGEMKLLP